MISWYSWLRSASKDYAWLSAPPKLICSPFPRSGSEDNHENRVLRLADNQQNLHGHLGSTAVTAEAGIVRFTDRVEPFLVNVGPDQYLHFLCSLFLSLRASHLSSTSHSLPSRLRPPKSPLNSRQSRHAARSDAHQALQHTSALCSSKGLRIQGRSYTTQCSTSEPEGP